MYSEFDYIMSDDTDVISEEKQIIEDIEDIDFIPDEDLYGLNDVELEYSLADCWLL